MQCFFGKESGRRRWFCFRNLPLLAPRPSWTPAGWIRLTSGHAILAMPRCGCHVANRPLLMPVRGLVLPWGAYTLMGEVLKKQAPGQGGGWGSGASHTYLCTSIQSSTIHSNQEVEAGSLSTDEPSVVHSCDGALLSFRKRGDADPCSNVDEAEDIMVSETRQTQKDLYPAA